jgi:hypothetical protein
MVAASMNENLKELAALAELVESHGEAGHPGFHIPEISTKMRTVSINGTKYVNSRLGAMTTTACGI